MKIQLLVSQWCPTCPTAEEIWTKAASLEGQPLEVLDIAKPEGRQIVVELGVRTVPAAVIDGTLRAVGVISLSEARALVRHVTEV